MVGYDPVRDAGSPERASPAHGYRHDHGARPSPSSVVYANRSPAYHDDPSAPRRSLSGQSLDKYGDTNVVYSRHNSHDASAGPAIISPRSSTTALPPHERYLDQGSATHQRYEHSPRNSMHAETPQHPRRSASIADLIAVSEMSDAEHDRHREAHRWSVQHGEEMAADRSMSRSSSQSGGFHGSSAPLPHSTSHPRFSHPAPHHLARSERSPSMAHLLNDGTAGAIQDRPRSGSHSSVSSHVSHPPPPQHHLSQMSPLGHPSSYPAPGPPTYARDRSSVSHPSAIGGQSSYQVNSPTSAYPPGMHPQNLSTLNRGGSSPGLGPHHAGHPAERSRYAPHSIPAGHGHAPRSASGSYAYASASASPASYPHAHLQPSPSHRFAVPDVPSTRSPETRRVPLPHSPTLVHSAHPRASLTQGQTPSWNGEEYESSSAAGMPPPLMHASPRRESLAHPAHRYAPSTPHNGMPPTPGSATSHGAFPITPGSKSLPPHTPNSPYARRGGDGYEESNYFPQMAEGAHMGYDRARERTSSVTSPHLRQSEHSRGSADFGLAAQYDDRGYGDRRGSIPTPGSGYPPDGPMQSRMRSHPALPPTAPSPSFGPQRRTHNLKAEEEHSLEPNGRRQSGEAIYTLDHDRARYSQPRNEDFKDAENQSQPGLDKNQHASQQTSSRPVSRDSSGRDIETTAPSSVPTADTTQASHDTSARQADPHRSSDASIEEDRSQPEVRPPQNGQAKDEIGSQSKEAEQETETKAKSSSKVAPLPRYAPTHRVSAPRQVMRPIGIEEIDRKRARCRNPLRREWEQLHQTDSREALDEILRAFHTDLAGQNGSASAAQGDKAPASDAKKRALGDTLEDAEEVADHYNKRREVGVHGREESPIIALRKFNNWIKSVLVGTFARGRDQGQQGHRSSPRGGRILDLGCGKGGDLKKWEKVSPSGLVGADIAAVSIEQAITRHRENRQKYPGDFFAFDCFSTPLTEVIPRELLEPMFDNVTLQFCMHYAWESVDKARMMLDNVSRYLRRGGVFIGTIPDSRELRDRLAASLNPGDRSFGNRYYKVVFDQVDTWPAFGNRYTFFLEDAVENVPEYVVDFEVFEDLALEVGLRCVYRRNFAEMYEEGSRHYEHGKLLERMRVVDRYGSLALDEEMWQAATLYLGFAFEKM